MADIKAMTKEHTATIQAALNTYEDGVKRKMGAKQLSTIQAAYEKELENIRYIRKELEK